MAKSASDFRRKAPRFKAQPRVLVLCEDTISSKRYLDDAKVHFRAHAVVEIAHCGHTDPLSIVKHAVKRQKDYEQVCCVIDRDTHLNFDAACQLAAGQGKVDVFPSHPCFEFWLLLHFGFSRHPFTSVGTHSAGDRVVAKLKTCQGMAGYDKGGTGVFALLKDRLADARAHAVNVMIAAENEQELNPSTRIHSVLDLFETLSEPVPI